MVESCRHHPVVHHTNGIPLLRFEWANREERKDTQARIAHILKHPPLSDKSATVESSTKPFDARGLLGWDAEM
jgi:hypothetical protein|eukprot:7381673-Prymnesium_polylepis.2